MANESHIRIDEGIKRGPKNKYKHTPPSKTPDDSLREAIPADLDPDRVLDLYLSSPRTSQIAAELGIRRSTLTWWMRKVRPEQWKQVQVLRALMKKESADEGLEDAKDALSLARARELLKSGQWDLERLDSGTFGVKVEQTIEINHHVLVEHGLADSALTLFESMRSISPSNQSLTIEPDKET